VSTPTPLLEARGLVKRFGQVVALNDVDFDLFPGEITAIIGDNGAGKSTLIKVLSGAFQDLAVAPALDIATNIFLGRELRRSGPAGRLLRALDKRAMRREASRHLSELKIGVPSINQAVENLSGGQRQGVAVARAAAWGRRLVIMDEPTAALGVKETRQVLDLILRVRDRGLPVILISHDMPHVFELADRIQIMRLGKRVAVVTPETHSMPEAVAIMTGATQVELERSLTKGDA
jgi:fructose transport system ATP-binding protein